MRLPKFLFLCLVILSLVGCGGGIEVYKGKIDRPEQSAITNGQSLLLKNGKVLVYNPQDFRKMNSEFGPPNAWQIFDPETQQYTSTDTPQIGAEGATVTLLKDGRVLLAGGGTFGYGYHSETEIYDPLVGRFIAGPNMLHSRSRHNATLLKDGNVLIAGGENSPKIGKTAVIKEVEIYEPKQNKFYPAGILSESFLNAKSLLLSDGRVFIADGTKYQIYDPAKKKFTVEGKLRIENNARSMVLLPNDRVLLPGSKGQQVVVYLPDKNKFEIIGKLKSLYNVHASVLLDSGKVLLSGSNSNLVSMPSFGLEIFDLATNTSEPVVNFHADFAGYSMTCLSNKKVLLTGAHSARPVNSLIYKAE